MHQEDFLGLRILHIDPTDQLSTICSLATSGSSESLLLVLPPVRQAFTHAKDFHKLQALNAPSISLVIPENEQETRQWAKENGFSLLFSSFDDVLTRLSSFQPSITTMKTHKALNSETPLPTINPLFIPITPKQPSNKRILTLLMVLCVITVLTGSFFFFIQQSASTVSSRAVAHMPMVGTVGFESSRKYNQNGTSGISDQVSLSLQHLVAPASGQAYYAWLLNDEGVSDGRSLLLGKLSVENGTTATLTYTNPQQNNLLASFSQFLVTEEEDAITPIVPSPDQTTWHYSGMITQIPNPTDARHFSLLDHLRHLLANDPTLEPLGLHGGLDYWQYKNCSKLIEWTQSARDDWGQPDTSFLRRQLIRTLDYLDGTAYVYQDVPAGTPLLVDPTLLHIGLIDVSPTQASEGFFPHIDYHLTSLSTSPGVTSQQKQITAQVIIAINNIIHQLQQARQDAKTLLTMSDAQLYQSQAQILLDELANLTNDAYAGNAQQQQGSIWIHQQIEQLATFTVKSV